MKNIVLATALVFAGTTAMAADFESNEFVVTAQSGQFELSLGTVDGDLNTVSTTAVGVAAYSMGRFDTSIDLGLTYGRLDDTLGVAATYNLSTAINPVLSVYGSAELAYVAPTADLGAGDVFATPTLGAAYTVTDGVTAFGEVSYGWNASEDWARQGGALEVGADFFVTEKITLTPSVVHTFDTASDATNLKLEAALRF